MNAQVFDLTDPQGVRNLRQAFDGFRASDAEAISFAVFRGPGLNGSGIAVPRSYRRDALAGFERFVIDAEAALGITPGGHITPPDTAQAAAPDTALAGFRARCSRIITAGADAGKFVQAVNLALDTDLPAPDALAMLEALPSDASAGIAHGARMFGGAARATPKDPALWFTLGDIFIPPHMVAAANIEAGYLVEGIAISSFDKKRGKWGMKAIKTKSVARNYRDFGKVAEEEHDDDW